MWQKMWDKNPRLQRIRTTCHVRLMSKHARERVHRETERETCRYTAPHACMAHAHIHIGGGMTRHDDGKGRNLWHGSGGLSLCLQNRQNTGIVVDFIFTADFPIVHNGSL